ncbi:MAG TPA: FkbM family methyltransferase [Vicinamibacterales bacterium]|nr:FkbM family methyltransferase [Vicinamibacterales bacterium]
MEHHPLIRSVPRREQTVPGGSLSDQLTCSHYRYAFVSGFPDSWVPPAEPYRAMPSLPGFDDEYFDWVALVESVAAARDRFVFVELGAGFGRWLIRALKLATEWRGLTSLGVAVEAEPQHFAFMQQHLCDNAVPGESVRIVQAAIDARDGVVPFATGRPSDWYGQSIARKPREGPTIDVPALTLETLLAQTAVDIVDLVHMDVQKAEAVIVPASRETLRARVRRVCIGIHGKAGAIVRDTLAADGWRCEVDYPRKSTCDTPYGSITFGDGVQVWRNPGL